jgi:hypothetical protein
MTNHNTADGPHFTTNPKQLHAKRLIETYDWSLVVIPPGLKGPNTSGWQKKSALWTLFNPDDNIGVRLGSASAGLADLDCDCTEARLMRAELMPPTLLTFGRASTGVTHAFYLTDKDGSIKHLDPKRSKDSATIAELRAEPNKQTMIPNSTHPNGELVKFLSEGEPTFVPYEELKQGCGMLSAACLVLRYWPEWADKHHDFTNAFAGMACRADVEREKVRLLFRVVMKHAGDHEPDDRLHCIDSTYDRLEADRDAPTTGGPALAELIGDDLATAFAKFLGWRSTGEPARKKRGRQPRLKQAGERKIDPNEFVSHQPDNTFIHRPTGLRWTKTGVNIACGEIAGKHASDWVAQHHPVDQVVWAPGHPEIVPDWYFQQAGWAYHPGARAYNQYKPPTIALGDPHAAGPWLEHISRVYPSDAGHIVRYLAHRRQRPADKINHALVLGGNPGIGKDTLLHPVIQAVGPWNTHTVSPSQLLGQFTPHHKSIILLVSEARDLGDGNRYALHEGTKTLIAAPPDMLSVNEKFLPSFYIQNCVAVIFTTNNRTNGLYLPPDDRRHYVAWSDAQAGDFAQDYWTRLYGWFADGGNGHVAAYLAAIDLSDFYPKAPPAKTPAFWSMVDASRSPEEGDLTEAIERIGNPAAVTLDDLAPRDRNANPFTADPDDLDEFRKWLRDSKNTRQIPHRMEAVGYVAIRNDAAKDGLWRIKSRRQAVYARSELSRRDQLAAAQALTGR